MKRRMSLITLLAMMGLMLWCTTVFYPRYNQGGSNATLAWDAAGYYWYLPSVAIYHDLGQQRWADSIIHEYGPGPRDISELAQHTDNGRLVMKYPAGIAIAEAPFFVIAHVLAKPLGYPADGFSKPYQVAIQLGALLVAFIGLWLFRRLLLLYYSDGVVACCLAVLVIGTNYLNYSAIDGAIAHNWLFTLYVSLMLCSRSFYLKPSAGKAAGIGALCGMAALMRPTDVIACIIPVLCGLESLSMTTLKARLSFFKNHRMYLLLAVVVCGGVMAIQPAYWKAVSGHWFVYSYGDQGFSWKHPHIWDYTFSYRSGWFTYTPVMILAGTGMLPLLIYGHQRIMIVVFTAIAFYIVTAWDIWWYAGTGGRAMVQYYPVLFFPIASLFRWLSKGSMRIWLATPIVLSLMYINVWFTWHAHRGSLYDAGSGMSKSYYWRVIGRWSAPAEVQKLKDGPYLFEGEIPAQARLIYANSLRDSTGNSLIMDSSRLYSPTYSFAYKPQGDEHWLRASAHFNIIEKESTDWLMTQFVISLKNNSKTVCEGVIRVQRLVEEGDKKRLWVDLELPPAQAYDSVSIHFWNVESRKRIVISGLEVRAF